MAGRSDDARDQVLQALEAAPVISRRSNYYSSYQNKMSTASLLTTDSTELKGRVERFQSVHAAIVREVRKVIVGQEEVLDQVLISLFVGGHCLITGLPGTAKTLLVRTIASAVATTRPGYMRS